MEKSEIECSVDQVETVKILKKSDINEDWVSLCSGKCSFDNVVVSNPRAMDLESQGIPLYKVNAIEEHDDHWHWVEWVYGEGRVNNKQSVLPPARFSISHAIVSKKDYEGWFEKLSL